MVDENMEHAPPESNRRAAWDRTLMSRRVPCLHHEEHLQTGEDTTTHNACIALFQLIDEVYQPHQIMYAESNMPLRQGMFFVFR